MSFPDAEKMHAKTIMVPMRDGVSLATDLYFPEGDGPWPLVLQRTPYSRKQPFFYAPFYYLLQSGFVLAVQDNRGRFDSEGDYRPFVDDMDDGYDTVEWLAVQPYSTGKVGMTGASAMGIAAYLAAMANPPHLFAGAVMVARNPNQNLSRFPGGLYLENGAGEWSKTVGLAEKSSRVPKIASLDDNDIKMDIRQYDKQINVPFIHLGGWFDIHLQATIDNFRHLQAKAAAPARGNQKLIMAASAHIGAVEEVVFPEDCGAPPFISSELMVRWFNHWLKGEDNGVMEEPAVRYYLMGDTFDESAPGNEWREDETWPPPSTPTHFYLQANGALSNTPAITNAALSYIYDPLNPVSTRGGNNLSMASGPVDQRPVSSRPDVLRFVSEPLQDPMTVVGQITAQLWVSTDAEDTDFIIKLVDIHPDGFEALVRDQGARLRHRMGGYSQTPVVKDEIYPVTIDLWSTALVFNKGHRLGVFIQSSNWPRFERHTNTWDQLDGYEQSLKACNTLHLGPDYQSSIQLPLVRYTPR